MSKEMTTSEQAEALWKKFGGPMVLPIISELRCSPDPIVVRSWTRDEFCSVLSTALDDAFKRGMLRAAEIAESRLGEEGKETVWGSAPVPSVCRSIAAKIREEASRT